MKTPQQWLETVDFDWDEQVSVRMIEAIQQDAFESGRVVGRKQEMLSMAKALREEGLVKAAKSLELWAESLSEATPNPLKSHSL